MQEKYQFEIIWRDFETKKTLLVPVDFTGLSEKVIEQAAILGSVSGSHLVLFHITDQPGDLASAKAKLIEKAGEASIKYKVTCESKVREGSIFKEIQAEAEENNYLIMVIGTHGVRGLKQKLMGADMIAMMANSSEEYHYFAQQDKENLLTNDSGIPVLCACNEVKI